MSLNYKIIPCHKCGELVSRINTRKNATCFNCKVERRKQNAKKYLNKAKCS